MCALFAHGDGIAVHVDDRWFRVSAATELILALLHDGVRARARAVYHEHEAVRHPLLHDVGVDGVVGVQVVRLEARVQHTLLRA